MEQIKDAFQRVKEDIDSLKLEIDFLKSSLVILRKEMIELCDIISKVSNKKDEINNMSLPTTKKEEIIDKLGTTSNPTDRQITPPDRQITPTHNLPLEPLKDLNFSTSIGNEGVPTDRQTDRQTDQQTHPHIIYEEKNHVDPIKNASQLLSSLDEIKKELRLKFKRLTDQEILVFSTIYQLEEEQGFTDYKSISQKLNLTESSIRDYVGRLIQKNIPIDKKKINNKSIQISISPHLKKIASLSTILNLRDL